MIRRLVHSISSGSGACALLILTGLNLGAAETNTAPAAAEMPPVPVSSATGPSRPGLDAFRIIFERNIFNPNRSARRGGEVESTRREPERRPVRTESFALVGTMIYEKGPYAFFDSSNADYRKVLTASDSIAGYTIAAVTPEQVTLQASNAAPVTLKVGMQMRRQDEGAWEPAGWAVASESVTGSGSPAGSGSAGTTGSEEEILKRMMQRREQEGGAGSSSAPAAFPAVPAPPASPSPAPAGGSDDEIVKRLLQKREQELQK